MKKMFTLFAALAALFMISCGGASTPSDAAKEVYDLMMEGKYEEASKCFYFGEKSEEEQAQGQAMILSLLKEKAVPMIEKKGGLKDVVVLGETITEDGKSAKVEVKLVYGNGKEENNKVDMVLDANGDWRPAMNK